MGDTRFWGLRERWAAGPISVRSPPAAGRLFPPQLPSGQGCAPRLLISLGITGPSSGKRAGRRGE